ncbi:MAG: nuclear transport factor 2 family protein [Acidimicrobiales bacterium]
MPTDQELQELVDREAIKSVKHRYLRYCDAIDIPGMLSVFTDDCDVDFWPGADIECHGKAALEEFYNSAQFGVTASSHHLSNVDVVFTSPDRALVYAYLYSWTRDERFPEVRDHHRWARYDDVFVRTPDGWRVAKLTYLMAGEVADADTLRSGEPQARPIWTGQE